MENRSPITCPLCGSSSVRYFATHPKVSQDLHQCQECGLYFAYPHMSVIHGLEDAAQDTPQSDFWGSAEAQQAYMKWREAENARISRLALQQLPDHGPVRLLEVGFGDGPLTELVAPAVDEYWGIEPMPAAFDNTVARLSLDPARCLPIRAEDLDTDPKLAAQSGTFDVIIMVSVLEHLANPDMILRSCRRLLKPHGRLIVSTPDSTRFKWLYSLRRIARMEPWSYFHISFFTQGNLESAFARHHFSVRELTYGRLVTPDSVRYFRALTGSAAIAAAMSAFRIFRIDRLFRIQTLFYVVEKVD